jgi:hypothetical protein
MTNARPPIIIAGALSAIALVTGTTLACVSVRRSSHPGPRSRRAGVSRAASSVPDSVMFGPTPARFALRATSEVSSDISDARAIDTATRWALAFSTADPSGRDLSAPQLADELGDAGELASPVVQWAAWAGGTATTARVLVYLTAAGPDGPVGLSYDCHLARAANRWLVVGVAP